MWQEKVSNIWNRQKQQHHFWTQGLTVFVGRPWVLASQKTVDTIQKIKIMSQLWAHILHKSQWLTWESCLVTGLHQVQLRAHQEHFGNLDHFWLNVDFGTPQIKKGLQSSEFLSSPPPPSCWGFLSDACLVDTAAGFRAGQYFFLQFSFPNVTQPPSVTEKISGGPEGTEVTFTGEWDNSMNKIWRWWNERSVLLIIFFLWSSMVIFAPSLH